MSAPKMLPLSIVCEQLELAYIELVKDYPNSRDKLKESFKIITEKYRDMIEKTIEKKVAK